MSRCARRVRGEPREGAARFAGQVRELGEVKRHGG